MGSLKLGISSGLVSSCACPGNAMEKSNARCISRYNLCQASDRGRATAMERHVGIQAMSGWI